MLARYRSFMKQRLQHTIVGIFFLLTLAPLGVFAATTVDLTPAKTASFNLISIKTTPATPGPNEPVTITLKSFSTDLSASKITWYVDKILIKEGVGETTFTANTGDTGESIAIDVVILTNRGEEIKKHIALAPMEVDVLWEAQTYTPPFYKGKALPSYQSIVKMSAIPRHNATSSNPLAFAYKWTFDRTSGAGEGFGKSSTLVRATWPDSAINVGVEVSVPGTDVVGAKEISISSVDPIINFYQNMPLLGTYFDQVMLSASTIGGQLSLRAVPYFFSTDNLKNNELVYELKIGNTRTPIGLNPMAITIPRVDVNGETKTISLHIQNPKHIIQEAAASTQVTFTPQQ